MSFNPFDEFPLIPGTEALQHPLQLPEGDLGEKTRRKPRFFVWSIRNYSATKEYLFSTD